jgi:hypothetical protein
VPPVRRDVLRLPALRPLPWLPVLRLPEALPEPAEPLEPAEPTEPVEPTEPDEPEPVEPEPVELLSVRRLARRRDEPEPLLLPVRAEVGRSMGMRSRRPAVVPVAAGARPHVAQ